MTYEEKRAWIRLVVNVAAYAAYVSIILDRANGRPLPGVPYAATLLWTIGAAAAMLMAMASWDRFWIANTIYLSLVLSTVLASAIKVTAYRRGLPRW
jgi:hypothetical protein